MNIPVVYPFVDTGSEWFDQLSCSHCDSVLYDDRIGWVEDPEDVLEREDHRHKVGECRAFPVRIPVVFK